MLARGSAPRSPYQFLALAAGLTVPFWALGALTETPEGSPVQLPTSALALICPIAAAAILTARDEGASGVRRLLRRTVDVRGVRPRWWAAAVLLPPAAYVAAFGVLAARGDPRPAPAIGLADIAVLALIFLVAGAAEEAGWTGYATDPLRERLGALPAALVIGAVWGLVHVVPDLQGGHDAAWIAWQRGAGSLALRVLIVWLFANTGSVGLAVVWHAVENVCWQVLASTGPHEPSAVAPVFALLAAVVVLAAGPRTLVRSVPARGPLAPAETP